MEDAHRVEADDDLLVILGLAPQADVQLVEVPLQQLAGLFNPDARDVEDGLQLLHVVQAREEDFAAVGEGNDHIALVHLVAAVRVILGQLVQQLLEAALPQRPGHLPAHQEAVPRLTGGPLQDFAPGEDGLAASAAALQHQVAVGIREERHEGLVVGLSQLLIPDGQLVEAVYLARSERVTPPHRPPPGTPAAPRCPPGPGQWRPAYRKGSCPRSGCSSGSCRPAPPPASAASRSCSAG